MNSKIICKQLIDINSEEAISDRLPTARVINEKDGVYTIKAEGYGKGMRMWLGTQGERVRIIE